MSRANQKQLIIMWHLPVKRSRVVSKKNEKRSDAERRSSAMATRLARRRRRNQEQKTNSWINKMNDALVFLFGYEVHTISTTPTHTHTRTLTHRLVERGKQIVQLDRIVGWNRKRRQAKERYTWKPKEKQDKNTHQHTTFHWHQHNETMVAQLDKLTHTHTLSWWKETPKNRWENELMAKLAPDAR